MSDSNMTEAIDDTSIANPQEKAERKFDPGFKRNIKVIAVVGGLALVVMLVLLIRVFGGSSKKDHDVSEIGVGTPNAQAAPENMTPQMRHMLEERQRVEANEAARAGQSYIPPDTAVNRQDIAASAPAAVLPPPTQPSAMAQGTAPALGGVGYDANREAQKLAGLERQMALLLEGSAEGPVRQRIAAAEGEGGAKTAATAAQAAAGSATVVADKKLVGGLQIVSARMENVLKVSDGGGTAYASATITSGPLAGAFLIGNAKVVNSESLDITMTQMRFGDKMYAINAKVLDEATSAQAVSGNVDHRILQRYIMPVALAATQGFFAAKATVAQTAVNLGAALMDASSGGNGLSSTNMAGIAKPAPTLDQARAAGINSALQIAQQTVQQSAQAPITVSQGQGFPIGILFMEPVTESQGK